MISPIRTRAEAPGPAAAGVGLAASHPSIPVGNFVGRQRLIIPGYMVALLAVLFAGCVNGPANSSTRVRPVERLDLLLTSLAFDLDGKPGADGFGARIYATNRRSSLGATLVEGKLEISMYDGNVRPEDLPKAVPLRTWSYSATDLKSYAQKTSIGTAYRFPLAWGDKVPHAERITVLARYVGPDGAAVAAAPGTIPLAVK